MADRDLSGFGIEGAWTISKAHRIRWSECDLYGHVNHAAYLTLFEDLRIDYWAGRSGTGLSPEQPGPVVAQLEVRYLRPVRFRDEVMLTCRTVAVRRTSFTHEYALWSGGLACQARAVCVLVINATGARSPIPPAIRTAMIAGEGAIDETAANA